MHHSMSTQSKHTVYHTCHNINKFVLMTVYHISALKITWPEFLIPLMKNTYVQTTRTNKERILHERKGGTTMSKNYLHELEEHWHAANGIPFIYVPVGWSNMRAKKRVCESMYFKKHVWETWVPMVPLRLGSQRSLPSGPDLPKAPPIYDKWAHRPYLHPRRPWETL
jgi:hypothetical protein